MTEFQGNQAAFDRFPNAVFKGSQHARTRPPGYVKSGDQVAMTDGTVATPLGPADDGKEANTLLAQPGPFLARCKSNVSLSPLPGTVVFGPVEVGTAHPVSQDQFVRIADL